MKRFKNVVIIGIGLIGGSIGMAIRAKRLADRVIGVARRQDTIKKALRLKAIDWGTLEVAEGVEEADLAIIATPVGVIVEIARLVAKSAKSGCILTDVGSTKSGIVRGIESFLPSGISFVGGHPLAGLEKSGIDSARSDLFEGCLCILTRTTKTPLGALSAVRDFWQDLGSWVGVLSPNRHDRIVSRTSHLPHLVATGLVNSLEPGDFPFISSGFRDTTRITLGNPIMWRDICLSNRDEIVRALDKFGSKLTDFRKMVLKGDGRGLVSEFKKARKKRDGLKDKSPQTKAKEADKAVIAIDGPAASGKTIVAKLLAKKTGYLYVDTGAMYRALTLKAIREGIDLEDEEILARLAGQTKIKMRMREDSSLAILLDGEDVTDKIRTPDLTDKVSYIAKVGGVRGEMVKLQRKMGRAGRVILEGRDIGTVVLPGADKKFYLDAKFSERARRRYKELCETAQATSPEEVKRDLRVRDKKDMTRKIAPLAMAEDAIYIDTTNMSIDEVVERILGAL